MATKGRDPVDDLYERDPQDFVAARNQLVRELRRAGDKEQAAEVAKLRRPSTSAWAVNQLARRHRPELDELLRAGEELRSAQDDALAGGDPDTLREAGRARRDAVARLVDRAAAILAEQGSDADAHRSAIASTLEAASRDADAARLVAGGRLSTELAAPSGFGELELEVALRRPARPGRDDRVAQHQARQEAKERGAQADRARARADAARRRLEKADEEVANAEHALSAARRRAATAAEEVARAEQEAGQARQEAERAAAAVDG